MAESTSWLCVCVRCSSVSLLEGCHHRCRRHHHHCHLLCLVWIQRCSLHVQCLWKQFVLHLHHLQISLLPPHGLCRYRHLYRRQQQGSRMMHFGVYRLSASVRLSGCGSALVRAQGELNPLGSQAIQGWTGTEERAPTRSSTMRCDERRRHTGTGCAGPPTTHEQQRRRTSRRARQVHSQPA